MVGLRLFPWTHFEVREFRGEDQLDHPCAITRQCVFRPILIFYFSDRVFSECVVLLLVWLKLMITTPTNV